VLSLALIAFLAIQGCAEMPGAPFFGEHPGPRRHRRLMTHMLAMAAVEIRNPVAFVILMVPYDPSRHRV
jgi:hypothetical protein